MSCFTVCVMLIISIIGPETLSSFFSVIDLVILKVEGSGEEFGKAPKIRTLHSSAVHSRH